MSIRSVVAGLLTVLLIALMGAPVRGETSDPFRAKQWGLDKIKAEEAWEVSRGTGALVAVVDTGVDLTHPDLQSNLTVYNDADFVEPNGTCTRGKKGQRTCIQDGAQDRNGHGTHVAGIVAATTNNDVGVAGTAPGAKVLPVRVLDAEGSGTTDQVAAGIRYAADKGADVINLSLGFLSGLGEVLSLVGELDPVYDAIAHAYSNGAVVVIAAGNDSFPLCAEPSPEPSPEPSAAEGVVCVGATDTNDLRSWFSNGDATMMKNYLVAPGGDALTCSGDIFSTYLRSERTYCSKDAKGNEVKGYEALAGTSMAAPFVSGVAALLSAQGLTNEQIVDRLKATTDDLGLPGQDRVYGYGRVNASKAVGA